MMPVLELASRYVYPSVMRRLAEVLVNSHGVNKVEAARLIGASPSAVTRYLKAKRGATLDLKKFDDVDMLVKDLAARIVAGSIDYFELYAQVTGIALYVMGRRYVCKLHEELEPELKSTKCNVCSRVFSPFLRNGWHN